MACFTLSGLKNAFSWDFPDISSCRSRVRYLALRLVLLKAVLLLSPAQLLFNNRYTAGQLRLGLVGRPLRTAEARSPGL